MYTGAQPQREIQHASVPHVLRCVPSFYVSHSSTAHRKLKHDLANHPYKLQIVQELKETNLGTWEDFCEQFLHFAIAGKQRVVMSD